MVVMLMMMMMMMIMGKMIFRTWEIWWLVFSKSCALQIGTRTPLLNRWRVKIYDENEDAVQIYFCSIFCHVNSLLLYEDSEFFSSLMTFLLLVENTLSAQFCRNLLSVNTPSHTVLLSHNSQRGGKRFTYRQHIHCVYYSIEFASFWVRSDNITTVAQPGLTNPYLSVPLSIHPRLVAMSLIGSGSDGVTLQHNYIIKFISDRPCRLK